MKVYTMMKFKVTYVLVLVLFTSGITGCFESNSEVPPPELDIGNGGGAPLGVNDTLNVRTDSSGGLVDVLRNDFNGVEITGFDATSEKDGAISRDGTTGRFTYIPPAAYSGEDSFTYSVKDSSGNTSKITVKVTVNNAIIDSGRDYFNRECGICHRAGNEDQQSAFNATDLALSLANFDYDLSLSDKVWNPPLMLYYSNLSQKELDGLRAYVDHLKNP